MHMCTKSNAFFESVYGKRHTPDTLSLCKQARRRETQRVWSKSKNLHGQQSLAIASAKHQGR